MPRQPIRDRHSRLLGYIEERSDGTRAALDAHSRLLGRYDPRQDVTCDAHSRRIARGDVLSALIWEAAER